MDIDAAPPVAGLLVTATVIGLLPTAAAQQQAGARAQ
jgi:hypothetical protein